MTLLRFLGDIPLLQTVGWVVVHSLWQGAALAVGIGAALRLMRHRSADTRYLVACAGLTAMVAVPIATALGGGSLAGLASSADPIGLIGRVVGPALVVQWIPVLLPAAAVFWFVGACVFLVRSSLQWRSARRLLRDGIGEVSEEFGRTVRRLAAGLSISRPVGVRVSSVAPVPMVIGWMKPVILLPVGALTGLTGEQLQAIVAHELAHVRRHDYLVNVMQIAIESLMFYHPAVWWLSGRIRIEREYCCDDLAVSTGPTAVDYARALASLEEARPSTLAFANFATGGSLLDRISRIVGEPRPVRRSTHPLAALLVAIVLAVVLVATGVAMAGPPNDGGQPQLRRRQPAGQSLNLQPGIQGSLRSTQLPPGRNGTPAPVGTRRRP